MRVAILGFSMQFQRIGGLEIQMLETISALQRLGCDARLFNVYKERISDFEVVHVFSVINGNHRIVEFACAARIPVVLSPLIRPHWTKSLARRARLADTVVGRLTHWNVTTEYRQITSGLTNADRCIALGNIEKRCIHDAFNISADRIDVIPNGIPQRFFDSCAQPFLDAFGLEPGFVLCVASIDGHKNQLGLARALSGSGHKIVLIGEAPTSNRAYLEEVLSFPEVRHVGSMDYENPLLASAYRAAGVFCLPSMSEVMPLTVLESLAAGTPSVMTRHHCMDIGPMNNFVTQIDPTSASDIRQAVDNWLAKPPDEVLCKNSVAMLTWDAVAKQVMECYDKVLRSFDRETQECRYHENS
jgi:glycosyltransferase involved in cell wall biosynthesis